MKISKLTQKILSNFRDINPSLYFRQGDLLKTMEGYGSIFAKVKVEEVFPQDFAIYDLNKFLYAIDLLGDPDLEFSDDSKLVLRSGNRTLDYYFADPANITYPEKTMGVPKDGIKINLSAEDVRALFKAVAVVSDGSEALIAVESSEEGSVAVLVSDKANKIANRFQITLPDAVADKKFKAVFDVDTLKILPGSYEVMIVERGDSGFGYFKHGTHDLHYWIAVDATSEF